MEPSIEFDGISVEVIAAPLGSPKGGIEAKEKIQHRSLLTKITD